MGIFIIGCGEEMKLKVPNKVLEVENIDTKSNTILPLEGYYKLKEGNFLYSENSVIRNKILDSNLVIEKLDSDDYGYYFTVQIDKYNSIYFGIIHKQDNDFFKKIIYTQGMQDVNVTDMNITEEMADENLTTELKEKIKVSRDGDILKIDMPVDNSARVIIKWKKTDTLKRDKKLQEAEHEYNKYYKERFNKYFKDD
jgi:hypothetical protein